MTAGADDAHLIDLASRALGGSVLVANDETYAEKENLIKVAAPTFTPATMGPRGQVYEFKLNHVVEVDDPLALIRTEWIDLSTRGGR